MPSRAKGGCLSVEAKTIANALRLADGCIKDARSLFRSGSRNAAYLAEQSLEQVIRALATSENLHIERHDAHQLDKVARRFPDEHSEKAVLNGLTWLEAYATTFRYTTPSGQIPKTPDAARLDKAIEAIETLIGRVADHFDVNLEVESVPAGLLKPMRSSKGSAT
jgi:HEPN domain-containing protein